MDCVDRPDFPLGLQRRHRVATASCGWSRFFGMWFCSALRHRVNLVGDFVYGIASVGGMYGIAHCTQFDQLEQEKNYCGE